GTSARPPHGHHIRPASACRGYCAFSPAGRSACSASARRSRVPLRDGSPGKRPQRRRAASGFRWGSCGVPSQEVNGVTTLFYAAHFFFEPLDPMVRLAPGRKAGGPPLAVGCKANGECLPFEPVDPFFEPLLRADEVNLREHPCTPQPDAHNALYTRATLK